MNLCYFAHRWGMEPCKRRMECVDICRAGWVIDPVPCARCGIYLMGPFMSTITDNGGEDATFRFLCPTCALISHALEKAEEEGYAGVIKMLQRKEEGA